MKRINVVFIKVLSETMSITYAFVVDGVQLKFYKLLNRKLKMDRCT